MLGGDHRNVAFWCTFCCCSVATTWWQRCSNLIATLQQPDCNVAATYHFNLIFGRKRYSLQSCNNVAGKLQYKVASTTFQQRCCNLLYSKLKIWLQTVKFKMLQKRSMEVVIVGCNCNDGTMSLQPYIFKSILSCIRYGATCNVAACLHGGFNSFNNVAATSNFQLNIRLHTVQFVTLHGDCYN